MTSAVCMPYWISKFWVFGDKSKSATAQKLSS